MLYKSEKISRNCTYLLPNTRSTHTVINYFSPMIVHRVDPQWNYDVTWNPGGGVKPPLKNLSRKCLTPLECCFTPLAHFGMPLSKHQEWHIAYTTPRAVARTLIGGCIFIYSGSARLVSLEIKLTSKEISRAEPKYMNIHPPPISILAMTLTTPHLKFFHPSCDKNENPTLFSSI